MRGVTIIRNLLVKRGKPSRPDWLHPNGLWSAGPGSAAWAAAEFPASLPQSRVEQVAGAVAEEGAAEHDHHTQARQERLRTMPMKEVPTWAMIASTKPVPPSKQIYLE